MRRGLLAAAQLLRRSRSAQGACSELCAAGEPALAAVAGWAGGGDGSGSLPGGLPWALSPQAALHTPATALQPAKHSNASVSRREGDIGSTSSSAGCTIAAIARKKPGPQPSHVPDVDAEQLLRSLGLSGTADPTTLLRNLRKLPGVRQQGVLDNAAAVAAHLRSPAVGLTAQQAGQLLERCPALFSWPPEQRAVVLFDELLGAELPAAAVVQCLVVYPGAAQTTTLAAGLAELAAILTHSEDKPGTRGRKAAVPAAQRSVAALLSKEPSAVQLVCRSAGYLQQRAAELQQLGLTAADVAALVWGQPEVLWTDAAAMVASRAVVLQQELGLPAAEVVAMAAKGKPTWLTSSVATVRERAAALAEGFGRTAAAGMLSKCPHILSCDTIVWRRNLCYMAACGVADPKAVLRQCPLLLYVDHAAPNFLQRRLLLQRAFGLTATQLYARPQLLRSLEPTELAQRLQFVQHCGQAHRLVAKAARGGKPVPASAEERRPALSLYAVSRNLEVFLPTVGASEAEWEAWAAANPPAACPLYSWAQQAAADEAARLAAVLPPELVGYEPQQHKYNGRRQQAAALGV